MFTLLSPFPYAAFLPYLFLQVCISPCLSLSELYSSGAWPELFCPPQGAHCLHCGSGHAEKPPPLTVRLKKNQQITSDYKELESEPEALVLPKSPMSPSFFHLPWLKSLLSPVIVFFFLSSFFIPFSLPFCLSCLPLCTLIFPLYCLSHPVSPTLTWLRHRRAEAL